MSLSASTMACGAALVLSVALNAWTLHRVSDLKLENADLAATVDVLATARIADAAAQEERALALEEIQRENAERKSALDGIDPSSPDLVDELLRLLW